VEQIFETLILEFLANFLNFTFGISVWNSSRGTIYANAPLEFTYFTFHDVGNDMLHMSVQYCVNRTLSKDGSVC